MRQRLGVVGGLLLLAVSGPASALDWRPVGPPGGDVRALRADPAHPGVVYLGTSEGALYRSDDEGRSWRRLSPGFPLPGRSLDDIVVAPDGDVIVGFWEVDGSGGGVARSRDGGRTFTLLPGIAGQAVRALALAPSDPNTMVVGTRTGVFRSRDGGASWSRISPEGHPGVQNVGSVAIAPDDPRVIYAGTWHLPWKTTDGGRSWQRVSRGIVEDSDIMTLTLDAARPGRAFATACTGIYRSLDGGRSWARRPGIPSSARRTRAFAQSPDRPDTYFAGTTEGLWVSEDGTSSWRLATDRQVIVNAIAALPGGVVLVGCDGAGVLRSPDRGRGFVSSNAGFSAHLVVQLAFQAGTGRVFAVVHGDRHHGGVLTAPGLEGPWTSAGPGLEERAVLCLVTVGSAVLAGTDDGIYARHANGDGGWIRIDTVAEGRERHPRVASIATLDDDVWVAATTEGLLLTDDRGATWQRHTLGHAASVSAVATFPGTPGKVVAATALALFESRDGGRSFVELQAAPAGAPIDSLAFVPGSGQRLLAATRRGLIRSEDGGRGFTRSVRGLSGRAITGLACAPDGRTVYVADGSPGGIFRSDDAGKSFERIGKGELASKRVLAVGLDPQSTDRVVAAAAVDGLHVLLPAPSAATGASGAVAPAGNRDR